MRTAFLLASLVAAIFATLIGFGHVSEHLVDYGGWLALSVALYVAASLPFSRSE